MGERNFYLVWATVTSSLCHSHAKLILIYIASLINMWYFSHLSVIAHLPLSPLLDWELLWAGTRFQGLPSARHIRSCSVKCLLKEMWWVREQWWRRSWRPYREQPLTHFACLSWLNPHKNPLRHPRQSRGLMTCPTSCWVTGPGPEPWSASVCSPRVFYTSLFSPRCPWVVKLGLQALSLQERPAASRNSKYAFRISLITSFTKFVLCFFSLSLQVHIRTRETLYLRSQRIGHKYRISRKVQ